MSMRKKVCFLFLGLVMIMFVNACMPYVNLKREELTKGDMKLGNIAVGSVNNKRGDDYGGKNFEQIGKVRGDYGNPFIVETEPGKGIDTVLKEMAKASLEHIGYSAAQVTENTLRLDIDVLNFWCDGYYGYKIVAETTVNLVDPANGNIVAKKDINVERGFTVILGLSKMYKAFDDTVNDIQKELVAFIQSQEFQDAVKND